MNEHDTVVPSSRRVVGLLLSGELLASAPDRGCLVTSGFPAPGDVLTMFSALLCLTLVALDYTYTTEATTAAE